MKERLEKRLEELKREYESGQKMLAELDEKKASLQSTMLRISGAMQVLEEQLKADGDVNGAVDFDAQNEVEHLQEAGAGAE